MLNKKISDLLNRQINAELYSAYLYLAYTSYFDHISLFGYANWYKVQSQEEVDHAMIIYRYLTDQGESVRFDAIAEVSVDELGVLDVLREAKAHEQSVTDLINTLYGEAVAANDWKTANFLSWFIKEQSEEEKNAEDMLQKYLLYGLCSSCEECCTSHTGADFGLCGGGLYALNQELADRTYSVTAYPFE